MTTPPSGESSPGSAVPAFEGISEELARPPRSTVLPLAEKAEPLDYVDFDFDLPHGPRGTDLRADLPAYWQIHVTVPVAGPDLEAEFLAPVYRLPATWRRAS